MKDFGLAPVLCCAFFCLAAAPVAASQDPISPVEQGKAFQPESKPPVRAEDQTGIAVGDSQKLRIRVRVMGGYTHDSAQASLGFEKQGRIGYAMVGLSGQLNDRF